MPALILPFYGNGNVSEYAKGKSDDDKLKLVFSLFYLCDKHCLNRLHRSVRLLKDLIIYIQILSCTAIFEACVRHLTSPSRSNLLFQANVLVDDDGNARISDYGLAFIIEPSEFTSIKTAGACRWTAPEIMNPPEDDAANESPALFTKESDVYAFAMVVIEVGNIPINYQSVLLITVVMKIFSEQIPFSNKKNDSSVIFSVLDGVRPAQPPFLQDKKELGELVKECWVKDPGLRPTSRAVNEILNPAPEVCGNCHSFILNLIYSI